MFHLGAEHGAVFRELRFVEAGAGQVGLVKTHSAQVRLAEAGAAQAGEVETHVFEPELLELGAIA